VANLAYFGRDGLEKEQDAHLAHQVTGETQLLPENIISNCL